MIGAFVAQFLAALGVIARQGMKDPPGWVFGSHYLRERDRADKLELMVFRLLEAERVTHQEPEPPPRRRRTAGT